MSIMIHPAEVFARLIPNSVTHEAILRTEPDGIFYRGRFSLFCVLA
jgi:hypothetical protein